MCKFMGEEFAILSSSRNRFFFQKNVCLYQTKAMKISSWKLGVFDPCMINPLIFTNSLCNINNAMDEKETSYLKFFKHIIYCDWCIQVCNEIY